MNKEEFIDSLKEKDIEYLENLIDSSQMYLDKTLSSMDIIQKIDYISGIYFGCNDSKLTAFSGIWSDLDDIEDEIKLGKSSQKDLEDYMESVVPIMERCCKKIIEEYTPILEDLKKKYPQKPKKLEEDLDWDEWLFS